MNIFDTITLLKAGYSKKEIEAMKQEDAKPAEPAAEPAPAPEVPAEPIQEAEDPRISELQNQIKELQAKVIQLSAVPTVDNKDPLMDIANALINGGK